jgi:transcriptional regulator with XRE-family HTH domain
MPRSQDAHRSLWTISEQVASFLHAMEEHRAAEARRIGQLIADRREDKALSQQDLADKLDIAVSTVSRWERGVSIPSGKHRRGLTKTINVTTEELRPRPAEIKNEVEDLRRRRVAVLEASTQPTTDASSSTAPVETGGRPLLEGELGRRAQDSVSTSPGPELSENLAAAE